MYTMKNKNPFTPPVFSWWNIFSELAHMFVSTICCLPFVRFLGISTVAMFLWMLIKFATLFFSYDLTDTNGRVVLLPLWRRRILYPARLLVRVLLFFAGFTDITFEGVPSSTATILISNHQSIFDLFIIFAYTSCVPYLLIDNKAKDIPLLGYFLQAIQAILVDRDDAHSKQAGMDELLRRTSSFSSLQSLNLLSKGSSSPRHTNPLLLFPENVATNRSALITFQTTPFSGGVSVQPIVVEYFDSERCPCVNNILPGFTNSLLFANSKSSSSSFNWWWMFRLLCVVKHNVSITFLPLYEPKAEETRNTSLYATNVRKVMAKKLDIECTSSCYNDAWLLLWSDMNSNNMSRTIIELRRQFSLPLSDVPKLLFEFERCDINKDEYLTFSEFCRALKVDSSSSFSAAIFDLLDIDGTALLDYRAVVVGMYSPKYGNLVSKFEFAFRIFDVNGALLISENDALELLCQSKPYLSDSKAKVMLRTIFSVEKSNSFSMPTPNFGSINSSSKSPLISHHLTSSSPGLNPISSKASPVINHADVHSPNVVVHSALFSPESSSPRIPIHNNPSNTSSPLNLNNLSAGVASGVNIPLPSFDPLPSSFPQSYFGKTVAQVSADSPISSGYSSPKSCVSSPHELIAPHASFGTPPVLALQRSGTLMSGTSTRQRKKMTFLNFCKGVFFPEASTLSYDELSTKFSLQIPEIRQMCRVLLDLQRLD